MIAGLPGAEASHDREGIRAAHRPLRRPRRRRPAREPRRVPQGHHPDRRAARPPDVHPPRRPALLAVRPAPRGQRPRRLPALWPRPCPRCRTASPSAPARSARGPTTTSRRRPTALAPRIHFAHLRNVTVEADGSFFEDDHLAGRVDMVSVVGDAARRGGAAARRGPGGRGDPVPPRPRPPAARRPGQEDLPRLFRDRPAQGPRRAARGHHRAGAAPREVRRQGRGRHRLERDRARDRAAAGARGRAGRALGRRSGAQRRGRGRLRRARGHGRAAST